MNYGIFWYLENIKKKSFILRIDWMEYYNYGTNMAIYKLSNTIFILYYLELDINDIMRL